MKKMVIFLIAILMLINVGVAVAADDTALEQRVNELERQVTELQEELMGLNEAKTTSRTSIESGVNFGSGRGAGSSNNSGTAGF